MTTKYSETPFSREVTYERLVRGAKSIRLSLPNNTAKKNLIDAIRRKIAESPTYGRVACGGCGYDVNAEVDFCPFCSAKFDPLVHQLEKEIEENKPDPFWMEPNPAFKTLHEDGFMPLPSWEAAQEEKPVQHVDPEEKAVEIVESMKNKPRTTISKKVQPKVPTPKYTSRAEVEHKKTKKEKRGRPKGSKNKKPSKSADKKKELALKRQALIESLPLSLVELQNLARPALVMCAGIFGIEKPMHKGAKELIPLIIQKQNEKFS